MKTGRGSFAKRSFGPLKPRSGNVLESPQERDCRTISKIPLITLIGKGSRSSPFSSLSVLESCKEPAS